MIFLLWYDWKNTSARILSLLLHLLDFYAYHVEQHRIKMYETYLQHYPKKRLSLFSYCLTVPSFEDYFQTATRKFGNCFLKQHRNQHMRFFKNYNSFAGIRVSKINFLKTCLPTTSLEASEFMSLHFVINSFSFQCFAFLLRLL